MANYLDKTKGFVQHISSDVLLLATTSYKVEPSKGRKDVQTLVRSFTANIDSPTLKTKRR